jgi:hypothetical protein
MTAQRVAGVFAEGLPGTEVGVRLTSMSQCATSGLAWRPSGLAWQRAALRRELLYHESELINAAPHDKETEFKPLQLRRTCSPSGPLIVGRRLCRRDGQQPGQRRNLRPDHLHCVIAVGLPCQRRAHADQNGNGIAGKGAGHSPANRSPFTVLPVGRGRRRPILVGDKLIGSDLFFDSNPPATSG